MIFTCDYKVFHGGREHETVLKKSTIFTLLLFTLFLLTPIKQSRAQDYCACIQPAHNILQQTVIQPAHKAFREYVTERFEQHKEYWEETIFKERILPGMQQMTEQLFSAGQWQTAAIGTFFDAEQQLLTQRTLQEYAARAHKDYHPSEGMCVIGTTSRGLANTSQKAEAVSNIFAAKSIDRQLLNTNSASGKGTDENLVYRWSQFKQRYCDRTDSFGDLIGICPGTPPNHLNNDINYTRVIESPGTIDIDFLDPDLSDDETDVFALGNNLFSFRIIDKIQSKTLKKPENAPILTDLRSLVAQRGVAEYSFYSIVGMKARGSSEGENGGAHIGALLRELGIGEEAIPAITGNSPSYDYIMSVLGKQLYQTPAFYTDLYDKPANVARKGASLRAISLMQNMDRWNSSLRQEALLSTIAAIKLNEKQDEVQNVVNSMVATGDTGAE